MTAPPSAAPADELLVVAACAGARCRALRGLQAAASGAQAMSGADERLRAAVRRRPNAVLIATDCLGPCHHACVVAVGPGRGDGRGGVRWLRQPLVLGLAELPRRAVALSAWVGGGAPDVTRLPAELRPRGAA